MSTRTKRSIVHFPAPFALAGIDGLLPPGDYAVGNDEEPIDGIPWLAHRRVATFIHLPASVSTSRTRSMVVVDPVELDAASKQDSAHKKRSPRP